MKKMVVVEGLIGAGKSTFAKHLVEEIGGQALLCEELDEVGGKNPYLKPYYEDPSRWAFVLQAHMLAARHQQHRLAQEYVLSGRGCAVMDRGYHGDTAFARLQFEMGHMSSDEYSTYTRLYRLMTYGVQPPAVCVHLMVRPEVALERISLRASQRASRSFESAVSIEYLIGLQEEIQRMLRVLSRQGVHVLSVPWDEDRFDCEARAASVRAVADQIKRLRPPDFFDETDALLMAHTRIGTL